MLNALLVLTFIFGSTVAVFADELPAPVLQDYVRVQKPIICASTARILEDMQKADDKIDSEFIGIMDMEGVQLAYTIHRSKKASTFTILETNLGGNSCIISIGEYIADKKLKGPRL